MRTHAPGAFVAALALALGACRDLPTATEAAQPAPAAVEARTPLRCAVTIATRAVSCAAGTGDGRGNIILGGQGLNVRLVSSNVTFDGGDHAFSFDVTVQNLLDQPMGTDGVTPSGVRVFFNSGPTATEGSGTITVLTDSVGTFLSANQPYYKYDGMIEPRGVSQPQRWEFSVDAGVTAFAFIVYVETQLPAESSVLHWRPERGTQLYLNDIRGIFALSPHDVFAVTDGAVLHYDGNYWRAMDVGGCGCSSTLFGVWGSSSTNLYAVGALGAVLHWTGGAWDPEDDPDLGGSDFYAVWGTAADNVWVVGDFGRIVHFDGADWTEATTDLENAVPLNSVWGSGPNDVWAVGDEGTALHWDGASWTVQAFPDVATLNAVWGTAANDVWAAGFSEGCACSGGALYHYDGSTWSVVTGTPDLSETPLFAGWSSAPGDVWVAGLEGVLHYDGSDWTYDTVGYGAPIYGITGTSGSNVFAVGAIATIGHNQGSGWETMSIPDFDIHGMWGASATDVWAVGSGAIHHRTGGAWSSTFAPDGVVLNGIWGAGASDVWAVGDTGAVAHFDGAVWTAGVVPGVSGNLYGVWGSGTANAWAVGDDGAIAHWNGSAWSNDPVGTVSWYSVWGSSAGDVFVVGDAGEIQHWTGSSWSSMNSGTGSTLTSVWGTGPSDVYAVGFDGTVLHYDGNVDGDWVPVSTTANALAPVFAVWGSGPNDVFLLANAGVDLVHWDGTSWKTLSAFSEHAGVLMYTMWGSGSRDIYLGGDLGTVLHGER